MKYWLHSLDLLCSWPDIFQYYLLSLCIYQWLFLKVNLWWSQQLHTLLQKVERINNSPGYWRGLNLQKSLSQVVLQQLQSLPVWWLLPQVQARAYCCQCRSCNHSAPHQTQAETDRHDSIFLQEVGDHTTPRRQASFDVRLHGQASIHSFLC